LKIYQGLLYVSEEINEDLAQKKKILNWMIKNKIRELNDLGKVMNLYYSDKDRLMKLISSNNIKEILVN
jgi:hypothetical protein